MLGAFQPTPARHKKTRCRYNLQRALGVPDTIRTCDLQSRSLTLYPAELQAQNFAARIIIAHIHP